MLNTIFSNSSAATTFTMSEFAVCTASSVILGLIIALVYMFRNSASKGFVMTLALMPIIVQAIIMVVNGNIGTGVAVAGAFSLVRFRSVPGTARDICSIFLAMAVGLATGTGYIGVACVLVVLVCLLNIMFTVLNFGAGNAAEKHLVITIPESLDYSDAFEETFSKYTNAHELVQVRTTNMGSLFKLTYHITLNRINDEKEFLDMLRCQNGNLDIICTKASVDHSEKL